MNATEQTNIFVLLALKVMMVIAIPVVKLNMLLKTIMMDGNV